MGRSDMDGPNTISIRDGAETGRTCPSSTAKLLVARATVLSARLWDMTMVTVSVLCRRFDRLSVRRPQRGIAG